MHQKSGKDFNNNHSSQQRFSMEEGDVDHVDAERKVFSTYTCRSIDEHIGLAHPGDIAEPSSLRYCAQVL